MPELSDTERNFLKFLEHILPMDGTQMLFVSGANAEHQPVAVGVVILYPSNERSILEGMRYLRDSLSSSVRQMEHTVNGIENSHVESV